MIPRTIQTVEIKDWKSAYKHAHISLETLAAYLEIPLDAISDEAHQQFPLVAPLAYLEKIEKGNLNDPLLRQILPSFQELQSTAQDSHDPLQERTFSPAAGIIHKYKSRVLLIFGTHCAINCRYCFRRNFPYNEHNISRRDWQKSIDYIAGNSDINEVILSGGDPLAVSTKQLHWLSQALEQIPHLKRLRIHSRFPVVIPQRIDNELLDWFSSVALQKVLVLHINHPTEIDRQLIEGIARLKSCNVTLLNQSVLLRGINDNAETLIALSEKLFAAGVLPYYLHMMDHVSGASHYHISDKQAHSLHQTMQANLPGFLVPKLVREEPGKQSKTLLSPHK